MFGFIKRLFGGEKSVSFNDDPFGRDVPPPASRLPVSEAAARVTPPVVLKRDEIIDDRTRIAGYRFSVHHPDANCQLEPGTALEILAANGVAAFAERRLALIPLYLDDWARHDYR